MELKCRGGGGAWVGFKGGVRRRPRRASGRGLVGVGLAALLQVGAAAGPAYSRLWSFGPAEQGSQATGGLVEGSGGALYGTTVVGGERGQGTVFRLGRDGTGFRVLHQFGAREGDGLAPYGELCLGTNGALYGVTFHGGGTDDGTVFRFDQDGSGYKTLHSFGSQPGEGRYPSAGLVQAPDGLLYGTTAMGGHADGGIVFELTPEGTHYAIVHRFSQSEGASPEGCGLAVGRDGGLYGVTERDGAWGYGSVFRLARGGDEFAVLHAFGGTPDDGQVPSGSLVVGFDGAFYGVTFFGGTANRGTLFRLGQTGEGYRVLHHFAGGAGDGQNPSVTLTLRGGVLYGATQRGGASGGGTLFRINQDGTGFVVLHHFGGSVRDGQHPFARLWVGSDGGLYGTTRSGGDMDLGTVFQLLVGSPDTAAAGRTLRP